MDKIGKKIHRYLKKNRMKPLFEQVFNKVLDIIKTDTINHDEKLTNIQNIISINQKVLNDLNSLSQIDIEKKRKRFYYLTKKDKDHVTPSQLRELEELKIFGFGTRLNKKERNEYSGSDSSDTNSP